MLSYLIELRRRLLYVLLVFGILFLALLSIAHPVFHYWVSPLFRVFSVSEPLIATQITAPLFIPLKLTADLALLITTPFALLQVWYFVAPGLYLRERHYFLMAIVSSLILFCGGVLFCFYGILPVMLKIFSQSVPLGVRFMPDITNAVDFITRMLLLFGLCFQVPLICVVLVWLKVAPVGTLKMLRPYVIVGAFTVGMLFTPDIVSQLLLAIPLCALYEVGIVVAKLLERKFESEKIKSNSPSS